MASTPASWSAAASSGVVAVPIVTTLFARHSSKISLGGYSVDEAECRAKGIVVIGAATTPDEAAALQEAGVDAIAASGFEAGGHRGSFLLPAEDSLTGTLSLVPQVVDIVDVPVIAAGGIADARGVIAALALGAEGVQMGTVFLASEESGASRESPIRRERFGSLRG